MEINIKLKHRTLHDPDLIRWNMIKARIAKGLRQQDLGKMMGVSQKSISNWEKGIHAPRTYQAIKLVEILGEDITYLMRVKKYI